MNTEFDSISFPEEEKMEEKEVDDEFLQELRTKLEKIDQLSLAEIEERNKKFFETFGSFKNFCLIENEKLEHNIEKIKRGELLSPDTSFPWN